jgi:G3E family GTPase
MSNSFPARPVPITIITGYLGAGKTTLVNNILAGGHDMRIAVIINEFGEIGVDGDLVVNLEEDQAVYTLNNGCICCTVREDLIEALEGLLAGGSGFDQIVIETTGIAEPGPVVMALLNHPDIEEGFRVDGIVTVVDAKNLERELDAGPEAGAQIAYADRILLNKLDLVPAEDVAVLEGRIREINPAAPIVRTTNSVADVYELLDIGGFDAERIERAFAHRPESPDSPGEHHHPRLTSVSLRLPFPIDRERLDAWLPSWLESRHRDLYRMKGIINIAGIDKRMVVQGVHGLYTSQFGSAWEDSDRESRIVFIGRELRTGELRDAFEALRA